MDPKKLSQGEKHIENAVELYGPITLCKNAWDR